MQNEFVMTEKNVINTYNIRNKTGENNLCKPDDWAYHASRVTKDNIPELEINCSEINRNLCPPVSGYTLSSVNWKTHPGNGTLPVNKTATIVCNYTKEQSENNHWYFWYLVIVFLLILGFSILIIGYSRRNTKKLKK